MLLKMMMMVVMQSRAAASQRQIFMFWGMALLLLFCHLEISWGWTSCPWPIHHTRRRHTLPATTPTKAAHANDDPRLWLSLGSRKYDSYDDDHDDDAEEVEEYYYNRRGRSSSSSSSSRQGRGRPRQRTSSYDSDRTFWNNAVDEHDGDDDDSYEYEYEKQSPDTDQYYYTNNYYYDNNDHEQLKQDTVLEWESVPDAAGTVSVLLPPPSVMRPSCILHFVGGTFFGSAPAVWYRQLLQEIVQHTQAAVVATTIPVTILQSPLQHVALAQKVQRQLRAAWNQVLVDEYDKDVLKDVPVCAMGHSLGARLLVVLATLSTDRYDDGDDDDDNEVAAAKNQEDQSAVNAAAAADRKRARRRSNSGRPHRRSPRPHESYKACILMSFTNHGAAAGIPGISQLGKSSRSVEREQQAKQERAFAKSQRAAKDGRDYDDWQDEDDDYLDDLRGNKRRQSSSSSSRRQRRRRQGDDWFDDEDDWDGDDDEEWGEIFQDLQESMREQALKVKSALTPSSEQLEFYPSPDQLWKAVSMDKRYRIPQTLIVQFDNDQVDQSVKITQAIKDSSSVKFARIRGTHLTPVSTSHGKNQPDFAAPQRDGRLLEQINSRAGRILGKVLLSSKQQSRSFEEASMRELRQSIARYITEVVTKP